MREWLSGGAPPCQGGGRGFDPRLALLLFYSKNVGNTRERRASPITWTCFDNEILIINIGDSVFYVYFEKILFIKMKRLLIISATFFHARKTWMCFLDFFLCQRKGMVS